MHKRINALSIDLEDWYQGLTSTGQRFEDWDNYEDRICKSSEKVLNILADKNVRTTFFVLGYIAEKFPAIVEKVYSAGHEIAIHGYNHKLVYNLTPEEFEKDIDRSLKVIKEIIDVDILGYRAPCFSINKRTTWALEILRKKGFKYDSSIFPTKNMLYGMPDAPRYPHYFDNVDGLMEFPPSTIKIAGRNIPIAGGFYVRAFPIRFIKWAISKINSDGYPAVMYFHPWEFDPEQPKPSQTSFREMISHYYNLKNTENKFKSLLDEFEFRPMKEFIRDWIVEKES